jgi:hypothetical protein
MTGFNKILSNGVILSNFSSCIPWKHTQLLTVQGRLPYNCVKQCYGKVLYATCIIQESTRVTRVPARLQ